MRFSEFAIQETRLHRQEDLFKNGGFLHNDRIRTDNMKLQRLDDRFSLWQGLHIREIAIENEAIGEEFPDFMTAGIVDRETDQPVAVLMWTDGWGSPFPGSVEIGQVETDPRYQRKGFARYLYNLLRRQHTIVSDQDQSPSGAAMWVNMARAGIPVQGWVQFGTGNTPQALDDQYGDKYNYVEQLRKMNAQQIPGKPNKDRFPLYLFPVKEQGGRLDTPADTTVRVYQGDYINHWVSGLVAPKG